MADTDEKDDRTPQQKRIDAEIAASQANPNPETPANLKPRPVVEKRKPSPGVRSFRVRTRGIPHFRRAGIMFSPDPITVSAQDLTEAQQIELMNTSTLQVEELMAGGDAGGGDDAKKPKGAKG